MSKYYDINKLNDVKFCLFILQRRKHGIIITQKKKARKEQITMTENKVLKAYDDLILSKGFETASFLAKQEADIEKMIAELKDYLEDHPELEEDIVLTIDYLKEMKDDIKKCSEFLKIYCFEKMF